MSTVYSIGAGFAVCIAVYLFLQWKYPNESQAIYVPTGHEGVLLIFLLWAMGYITALVFGISSILLLYGLLGSMTLLGILAFRFPITRNFLRGTSMGCLISTICTVFLLLHG